MEKRKDVQKTKTKKSKKNTTQIKKCTFECLIIFNLEKSIFNTEKSNCHICVTC